MGKYVRTGVPRHNKVKHLRADGIPIVSVEAQKKVKHTTVKAAWCSARTRALFKVDTRPVLNTSAWSLGTALLTGGI